MRNTISMSYKTLPKGNLVDAEDEWSPLRAVIVGRPEHSAFPNVPRHLAKAPVPAVAARQEKKSLYKQLP